MSQRAHTVEKIGGTSMTQFDKLLETILIGKRTGDDLFNRIFVVSAYAGITDMLLEHKKSGLPGVYSRFANPDEEWEADLDKVLARMCEINAGFASLGLDVVAANTIATERIQGIRACLKDLDNVCTYGHFQVQDFLPAIREMLASLGEFHSAWNSVEILKAKGINATLADLTGWKDKQDLPFADKIRASFAGIDFDTTVVIATGYTKCSEGLMTTFDRGYSEITFSKIACVTGAREGVIHKEFHLSSGDPKLVGIDKVRIIGRTNFDVADQLADMGMEAIHPRASKEMEQLDIPIRVANAFEPEHPGTLISKDFKSASPRVEMVTGRKDLVAIEVHDPDMVGVPGYDARITGLLAKHKISYIAKNTNANTITHYLPKKSKNLQLFMTELRSDFPGANIRSEDTAIVSAIGSNINHPGFLARAAQALADAKVNILGMNQDMRQVNMQFIVDLHDFDKAIKAMHVGLVEN